VHDLVEAARRQHAVACDDIEIALFGVLRQITERTCPGHGPRIRLRLAGEDAQRGGLSCAVTSDESDAVAGLDTQGGAGRRQQGPSARSNFQVGRGDHDKPVYCASTSGFSTPLAHAAPTSVDTVAR